MKSVLKFSAVPFFGILLFLVSCSQLQTVTVQKKDHLTPIDLNATKETIALMNNLNKLSGKNILFGHQDAVSYGVNWKKGNFRSDVNDVTGKYPAVFGWELSKLENDSPINIDSVSFSDMKKWIVMAYEKGGVNTISWHMDNPKTGGNAWDVTPAVSVILPGGEKHELFKRSLDKVADFLLSLKDKNGVYVPIIFRPWHENDGNWFWWGNAQTSREDYFELWKFTVQYLRDVKNIHHLLYSYSWSDFPDEATYLYKYPGDKWVDVLGTDNYGLIQGNSLEELRILSTLALTRGKLAALTEGGDESVKTDKFYTEKFLNPVKNDERAKYIVYMLVWRNANTKHHYVPYPGHKAVEDFKKFEQDETTLFLEDLPDLYK